MVIVTLTARGRVGISSRGVTFARRKCLRKTSLCMDRWEDFAPLTVAANRSWLTMHWRGSLNNQEDQGLGAVDERDEGSFREGRFHSSASNSAVFFCDLLRPLVGPITPSFLLYGLVRLYAFGLRLDPLWTTRLKPDRHPENNFRFSITCTRARYWNILFFFFRFFPLNLSPIRDNK